MEESKKNEPKLKTRQGSGYLKQLYSTARTTSANTHSHLKSRTTFLVNFIPIDKVDVSELQVRVHFDDTEIKGLSESVKTHGVLQPILVVQDGDRYKVIAGERRLRAARLAGMDRIPARVLSTDDKATHEIALRENLDRVDLHPIEEGEGYISLLETQAYTSHEAIAKAFNKPKSRITECIGFVRLPDSTKQELMRQGLKNRALLRRLLTLDPDLHKELLQKVSGKEEVYQDPSGKNIDVKDKSKSVSDKLPRKAFEFKIDKKGISIPAFKWKKNEDKKVLENYLKALQRVIEESKTLI